MSELAVLHLGKEFNLIVAVTGPPVEHLNTAVVTAAARLFCAPASLRRRGGGFPVRVCSG